MRKTLAAALVAASISHAHAAWKQPQLGVDRAASPYNIGINLGGSWYTLFSITAGGTVAISTATLSGIIAAANMPALTGDVTSTAGTVATTIAPNVVTYSKFQQVAASSLVGNPTGATANAQGVTLGSTLAFSGTALQTGAFSGDCTTLSNSFSITCTKTNGVAFSALATTVPGTGVATALGVNVGSAGAFVVNGGALGTPSSGVATNLTGLPVSTGVSGLGTGVATALGNAVDASGGLTSYTKFSSVIPNPSTNVQSTGMPGINGGHWFIYNNAAAAFDTLPTLRVDRRTPTGTGTSGNTYKAIWAYVTTNANNVGYEWAITGEVINTAHGGQNVAVNGTITKTPNGVSTIGPSWGGNFVCHDTTTETDPTASCIGAELDVYADTAGTDANKQRVGLQIVAGNTAGVHVGRGLFMSTRTGVTIDRGFDVRGTYGIGFDTTAATFTGAAYLLASSQKIALDGATDGTYSRYISYNGTSLTYTTSSGSYWSVSDTGDVSAPSVTSLNPTAKWSTSNWGTQFLAKSSGGSSNPAIGLSNSSGTSWVAIGNTAGTLAFMSMSGNPGDTSFGPSYMLKMTTANAQFYGSVQPATKTIAGLSTCSSTLKGARYEVSNGNGAGTWGSTVSTTGSAQMPVRCDGTNWVYGG